MQIGYFGHKSVALWFNALPPHLHIVELRSINQVFEAMGTHNISYLALEPSALDDVHWLEGVIAMAEAHSVTLILLTQHLKPSAHRLTSWSPVEAENGSCLEINVEQHRVRHLEQPVDLSERAIQLLAILVQGGSKISTLKDINHRAEAWGWMPWTTGTLKTTIYLIRQRVGSDHILSYRTIGYAFRSCLEPSHRSSEEIDPSG